MGSNFYEEIHTVPPPPVLLVFWSEIVRQDEVSKKSLTMVGNIGVDLRGRVRECMCD